MAEPLYLRKIAHTPNDPNFKPIWTTKVQAEAAWDISKEIQILLLLLLTLEWIGHTRI